MWEGAGAHQEQLQDDHAEAVGVGREARAVAERAQRRQQPAKHDRLQQHTRWSQCAIMSSRLKQHTASARPCDTQDTRARTSRGASEWHACAPCIMVHDSVPISKDVLQCRCDACTHARSTVQLDLCRRRLEVNHEA